MPSEKDRVSGSCRESDSMRIIRSVRRIIRAADIDSRKLAAEHQITAPQLMCLMAVAEAKRATAIEVARRVHLDPSTLVGVMDRLEAKGLIKRERDLKDRRLVWIAPTTAGRTLVIKTPFPLQNVIEQALLRMTIPRRKQVATCIEHLAEQMAVQEVDSSPMLEIVSINTIHRPVRKGKAS